MSPPVCPAGLHQFANPSLLATALTHSTYASEARIPSNQRLEFLGDAVLKLLVVDLLVASFPGWPEGSLAKTVSHLVGNTNIAGLSQDLGVSAALRLGKGAEREGVRQREKVRADALEALIGAVYLDGGLDAVKLAFGPVFLAQIRELEGASEHAKTRLEEREQQAKRDAPKYDVVGCEGPDHDRLWVVQLRVDGKKFGPVRARSKRAAELELAGMALAGV